jgi:hypothetical protein
VGVSSEKTIGVSEFASESCGFATRGITCEKLDVSAAGHFLCFRKVRDEMLDLSEGHVVQPVVVSELECSQRKKR